MRLTFDTNLLVRIFVADDLVQVEQAVALVSKAEIIAVPIVALCEAVWVMRSAYKVSAIQIVAQFSRFLSDERVRCDRELAAIGLACLQMGGDFADGVIAADGRRLGGERLATFDRNAARRLEALDEPVTLLD